MYTKFNFVGGLSSSVTASHAKDMNYYLSPYWWPEGLIRIAFAVFTQWAHENRKPLKILKKYALPPSSVALPPSSVALPPSSVALPPSSGEDLPYLPPLLYQRYSTPPPPWLGRGIGVGCSRQQLTSSSSALGPSSVLPPVPATRSICLERTWRLACGPS